MNDKRRMKIGEVADATSLSLRTLRHYDDIGLVTPSARSDGGFRLYTASDVARIMLIRRMKPLGYSLDEMSALLEIVDAISADPASAELQTRLAAVKAEAAERRTKLATQVAMADEFVAQLTAI